ncbi:uncharacterized protein Z518_00421 [Rhinocladiella mackenziei CBS 650.93]|uniref:RNA-dependent RNA polymerase n=1 Tax=Rhinocladiella mackenziei CBS 650.93 TaxID=1442369 RepID=A0A0D2G3X7_9EURO|nr:uncharacterized protein Z518_00421 [Rhinocladiella mackenziei CBS 650.93]KIX09342.1 hypothetical protein Z518_00421 [Rhinocladiella mackenziei CBS 650.93]
MPETPRHVGGRVDKAIHHLNAQWDLGLPRLHGEEAIAAEAKGPLARKCSSRIRYLCFRTDGIDSLLAEFEQRARQIHSKWIFKPSQERGTLPSLPVTKSFVARDIHSKYATGLRLSDSQRNDLLQLLYNVLNDDFELARMTDSYSYERSTDSTYSTAPTTPRQQDKVAVPGREVLDISEITTRGLEEPEIKDPMRKSAKRSLGSPDVKNKRQQTLFQTRFFKSATAFDEPDIIKQPDPVSFDTATSAKVSSVFTTSAEDGNDAPSNETSMISHGQQEDSQDLFPTQDVNDYLDDDEFNRSFNEACLLPNPVDAFDLTLTQNNPFKQKAQLPSDVPFWLCWELYRISLSLDLIPITLYKTLRAKREENNMTLDSFWDFVKQLCREKTNTPIPPKSDLSAWTTEDGQYESSDLRKVIYLTGTLDWNDDPANGLLKFRPNAIHCEQSCRLYRKFGADRFLVLSTPVFERYPYPEKLRPQGSGTESLHKKITEFLAKGPHFIAGRYWRVFYVEAEKSKNRKNQQGPRLKWVLFAERGYDIAPSRPPQLHMQFPKVDGRHQMITVEDLTQWHMPLDANMDSTDLRLFSRWSIGLSKTTPTVTLNRHEFLYLHDPPPPEPVMNDGCALMSHELALAIWASYGGKGDLPSAVQGRTAGAKGLWLVDYHNSFPDVSDRKYWIQVSDSQLKIKPHPRDRADADETQLTFEVLKWAGDCKEGHLNMQLITVLDDRGVPRDVLEEALKLDTTSYLESLRAAMDSPEALGAWLQEKGYARSESKRLLGSFPMETAEQIKLLLNSGFRPRECAQLGKNASYLLRDYMSRYVEKLWIKIPCSTVAFCAPDPVGVLEEGEIFISFSHPIKNPRTGLGERELDDMDVLVARNPAYLASDMQKRRAVYKRELRYYRNVVIFSTRGETPLASLLSGGDYDGDCCTIIWDPEIVKHFQNTEPPRMPREEECGMIQMSTPLTNIFTTTRPLAEAMEDFLRGCVSFNASSSFMGMCSSEHERLVYFLSQIGEPDKLSNRGAVKLAALAGYLVDSNKQGWNLSEKAWHALRREASGPKQLPEPAFKMGDTPRMWMGKYPNIMDFLKFGVAERQKEQALAEFANISREAGTYDSELSDYWKQALREAEQENLRLNDAPLQKKSHQFARELRNLNRTSLRPVPSTLADLLTGDEGLLQQIVQLNDFWTHLKATEAIESSPSDEAGSKKFHTAIHKVYEQFQAIEPKYVDHELRRRYEAEKEHPFPYWSLLRASCLHYYVCRKGGLQRWVWFVAGREFCQLKALHHKGEVVLMTRGMYDIMKVDTKLVKGLLLTTEVAEEDTFYDADEEMDDEAEFAG